MHVVADTLDDLLRKVYRRLVRKNNVVSPSKGQTVEEFGNLLTLKNPLARLSRTETKGTVFSCLGEFIWYMSGSNSLEVIEHYIRDYGKYSDDGLTIFGAYGPRIFNKGGIDQLAYVLEKLKSSPASRKAVIQLFDAGDVVEHHEDVPCTCTLQFVARSNKIQLHVNMRSNDAFKGLPHDVFSFTMLQEVVARTLDLGLGHYHHSVGSLHLYTDDLPSSSCRRAYRTMSRCRQCRKAIRRRVCPLSRTLRRSFAPARRCRSCPREFRHTGTTSSGCWRYTRRLHRER